MQAIVYLCVYWLFYLLLNRREVYRILQEEGIDLPRYAVLNRDPDKPDGQSAIYLFYFNTVSITQENTTEC